MIPLRDNVPSRSVPLVNLSLIAANAAIFVYELSLGPRLEPFLSLYGVVPLKYAAPWRFPELAVGDFAAPFLTSMFLHGGWMHLLSNMWVLYIFGDNVEDRLGHMRYLTFYLLAGLAASLFQLVVGWGSPVPTIGASGAIAGVMGAYFLLYPYAKVVTLVPIFIFWQTIELPAFLFLGLWIWSQVYSGTMTVVAGAGRFGGVAWWAHVGGFLAGVFLIRLYLGRRRL